MRYLLRRTAGTKPGQYAVQFLAPMLARPSQFRGRIAHQFYGRMKAIPLVPLIPAGVASWAMGMDASTTAAQVLWDTSDTSEAVKLSLGFVRDAKMSGLVFHFIWIHIIAAVRWAWHLAARKISDRVRTDGLKSEKAPWRFFVMHTSGCIMWLNFLMLVLSVVGAFYPHQRFQIIDTYLSQHFFVGTAVGFFMLLVLAIIRAGYTESLREIYVSDSWVRRVRWAAYATIVFAAFAPPVVNALT